MFLSRVGIRSHGSGWESWPFSMGNKIINPPVNRGQLRGGIWGCKASQSPSCWQVCSGRNPATFMVLVGSTPLLARVTGCEGWPFSMGKKPHSRSVSGSAWRWCSGLQGQSESYLLTAFYWEISCEVYEFRSDLNWCGCGAWGHETVVALALPGKGWAP